MNVMVNRNVKAILTGIALVLGIFLTVVVLRAVLVIGLLMLPFLLVVAFFYAIGYVLPNFGDYGRKAHKAAEVKARQGLDWLDFNSPHWAWPAIVAIRTFLDWLGLQVERI